MKMLSRWLRSVKFLSSRKAAQRRSGTKLRPRVDGSVEDVSRFLDHSSLAVTTQAEVLGGPLEEGDRFLEPGLRGLVGGHALVIFG
jgi:hypothetical protein